MSPLTSFLQHPMLFCAFPGSEMVGGFRSLVLLIAAEPPAAGSGSALNFEVLLDVQSLDALNCWRFCQIWQW